MPPFVDPRSNPDPATSRPLARTTADIEELEDLHRLCRELRLYEVERWIQSGHPLQLVGAASGVSKRQASALEIALQDQNYALTLLLLCNGYDSNLEADSPLNLALRARRWDLVDLLLEWGADPHQVDLSDLFGTIGPSSSSGSGRGLRSGCGGRVRPAAGATLVSGRAHLRCRPRSTAKT